MNIFFLETETSETAFFDAALPDQRLHFVSRLSQVSTDAEILCLFIRTRIDDAFLRAHPILRLIATRSTGTDHLDLAACQARDVAVCHVPSYGEHTVAEHTFALILMLSRRLREVTAQSGNLSYEATRATELRGKTLGVLGVGRIGRHVIRMAQAFGMRVVAFDIAAPGEAGTAENFEYMPLKRLLAEAHIITLHVPLVPETHHLLNRENIGCCRPGVVFINTARGGLIDTDALLDALDSGQVGAVGLDVLEDDDGHGPDTAKIIGAQIVSRLKAVNSPTELHDREPGRIKELEDLMRNKRLLARPNVVFTPHVAFNSVEAVARINTTTAENIRAFLRGNLVNLVAR